MSVGGYCQAIATNMALFNSKPHELEVDYCFLRGRKEEWLVAGPRLYYCTGFLAFSSHERAP